MKKMENGDTSQYLEMWSSIKKLAILNAECRLRIAELAQS